MKGVAQEALLGVLAGSAGSVALAARVEVPVVVVRLRNGHHRVPLEVRSKGKGKGNKEARKLAQEPPRNRTHSLHSEAEVAAAAAAGCRPLIRRCEFVGMVQRGWHELEIMFWVYSHAVECTNQPSSLLISECSNFSVVEPVPVPVPVPAGIRSQLFLVVAGPLEVPVAAAPVAPRQIADHPRSDSRSS